MALAPRAAAAGIGAGLLLALLGGTASAATTTGPTAAAAGWLAGQLTGPQHDHLNSSYTDQSGKTVSYADQGLTADAVLALDAAGVAQDAARRATAWLGTQVDAYAGNAPDYYPGSLAKLLLVADAQGVDPHAFGTSKTDLVKALQDEEAADGLYTDPDTKNGYQSVVTQALALVGLSRTPGAEPDAKAVSWLVGQECPDGGFQTDVRTSSTAKCTSEPDATAFAVQALAATGQDYAKAVGWLLSQRHADGGFGAPTSNANSTAVAVQALLAAGRTPSASVAYLRGLALGCNAPAARRGAVTYAGSYDDTAVRATSQAAQALAGKTLTTVSAQGAAAGALALACAAGPAAAGAPTSAAAAPAPSASPSPSAALPFTGPRAPVGPLAVLGAAAVLLGGGLLVAARRRRA